MIEDPVAAGVGRMGPGDSERFCSRAQDTHAWLGVQYIGDRDPDRIAEYVQEREDALERTRNRYQTVTSARGRKLGV